MRKQCPNRRIGCKNDWKLRILWCWIRDFDVSMCPELLKTTPETPAKSLENGPED